MCVLIEILCMLEGKIGLVCWQLLHNMHAMGILCFNLTVSFHNFLLDYFWNIYFNTWRAIISFYYCVDEFYFFI